MRTFPTLSTEGGLGAETPQKQCAHLAPDLLQKELGLRGEMVDSRAGAGKAQDEPEQCGARK